MSKFSLDKQMEIEVKVTFIATGTDMPVTGDRYLLRLFDKDFFGEDFLGESKLNTAGEGRIVFGHKAFKNALTGGALPDFYFVLYHNQIPVYQSKVIGQLNPTVIEQYQSGEGEVIDLGTFLVGDYG